MPLLVIRRFHQDLSSQQTIENVLGSNLEQ